MDQLILAKDFHWEHIEIFESKFELKKATENNAYGLFAYISFEQNEVMFKFNSKNFVTSPTYLTVQLDDNKHFSLDPDFLQYMNHSCDPNVFMDTQELKLIALKPIQKGDELSFFYPSTEWEMDQAFICNCGSVNCQGYISGANDLKSEILSQYQLNNFIKRKMSEADQIL
ncbi:MAG: SET domain-containing protein-lysine N-methyltransferase [Saprospiraceae bacterium]